MPVYRKYRNVPTVHDGIRFHSKGEAKRYAELKLLQKAGKIDQLKLQPAFPMWVNRELVCTYIADFEYAAKEKDGWVRVVEDFKGKETPEYKIKKKLFKALYGWLRFVESRATSTGRRS